MNVAIKKREEVESAREKIARNERRTLEKVIFLLLLDNNKHLWTCLRM